MPKYDIYITTAHPVGQVNFRWTGMQSPVHAGALGIRLQALTMLYAASVILNIVATVSVTFIIYLYDELSVYAVFIDITDDREGR